MTTTAAAALFLGAALTGFGILAFLAAAPGTPDVETLRLTYLAALHGRHISYAGLAVWIVSWPTASAGYCLLPMAAVATAAASPLVTLAAPALMQRAATWSF